MRKWIPIILVLLMLVAPVIPIASAIEYPVLTGHITDNAGIINAEYRQKIGEVLNRIEKNSTAEVVILTIKSLEGVDKAQYATEVGQRSGIGKRDVDNGLLLLIAMDDGQGNGKGAYFVATGYGLEGTLPDATVNRINEQVLLPYLKKGKETGDIKYYGQGIYEEMSVFEGLLTNNSEIVSKYGSHQSPELGIVTWIIIMIVIVIILVILFAALYGGGGGGGYSSGGYSGGGGWGGSSNGGSSGGGNSGGGGFGGGSFGGGGSGGGFKRAAGTVATVHHSSISTSSSSRSSSYNSGHNGGGISHFGGGGFGSAGFGGGKFGGGGSGGGF